MNIHLSQDGSDWTADMRIKVAFTTVGRGRWTLLDTFLVNLLAFDKEGEFVVKKVSDTNSMYFYDGSRSPGAAFMFYNAPWGEHDRSMQGMPSCAMDITYPRNTAGLNCNAEWSLLKY